MPDESIYLTFEGLYQPLYLRECGELIQHFSLVFPGWSIRSSRVSEISPVLTVSRDGDRYRLDGYWLNRPLFRSDSVAAICALVAELIRAYVQQDDQLLCLHGAAAEFSGRLVVFPSAYRAGKSVLCASLAASGIRLFCDDILPISLDTVEAIAPGLAPRLRLPLPANLDQRTRQFIDSHNRLQGANYLYLDLSRNSLIERGRCLPIGAFVLLQREPGSITSLTEVSEGEVLKQVVWQNFARTAAAPRILKVLRDLVADVQCHRLQYDRSEDAVDLLINSFDSWPPEKTSQHCPVPDPDLDTFANPQTGQFQRSPDIRMLQVDDECFLADEQGAMIHHLNSVGLAVWNLLDQPMTAEGISELLSSAFPELGTDQIRRDVTGLIETMFAKNLIATGDPAYSQGGVYLSSR